MSSLFDQAMGISNPEDATVPVTVSETLPMEQAAPEAGLQHNKILAEVDDDLKTASSHALATGLQILDRIFDFDPRQQGRMAEVAAQLLNTGVGAASERRKSAQKDQEIQIKKAEVPSGNGLLQPGKVDNMQVNVFTGDRNALMKMLRDADQPIENGTNK